MKSVQKGGFIMSKIVADKSCCPCSGNEEIFSESSNQKKQIKIEFLFLDQEACDSDKTSEKNVLEALKEVSSLLRSAKVEISLQRIQIETLEQSIALGFQNSPTIRVNGQDIKLNYTSRTCLSCGENRNTETSCRLWNLQGTGYQYLPKALLVGAILQEIFSQENLWSGNLSKKSFALKTLENFFALNEIST
jgi:hypothetical protein